MKPIWLHGAELWGCAKKSNILVIQKSQNKFLRAAVNAFRTSVHRHLNIQSVEEAIRLIGNRHEQRLHRHSNILTLERLAKAKKK